MGNNLISNLEKSYNKYVSYIGKDEMGRVVSKKLGGSMLLPFSPHSYLTFFYCLKILYEQQEFYGLTKPNIKEVSTVKTLLSSIDHEFLIEITIFYVYYFHEICDDYLREINPISFKYNFDKIKSLYFKRKQLPKNWFKED